MRKRASQAVLTLAAMFVGTMLASAAMQQQEDAAGAISAASRALPGEGHHAVYTLNIRANGHDGGYVFLNTESDYRDPRSVAVRIAPSAFAALRRRYGEHFEDALLGKTITVDGDAIRVRVQVITGRFPSGKGYYQVHIPVLNAANLQVVGEAPTGD